MIVQLQNRFQNWLETTTSLGSSEATALATLGGVVALVLFAIAIDRLVAMLIRASTPWLLERAGSQTPEEWKVALRQNYVAKRTAHIVAALFVYWLVESTLHAYPNGIAATQNIIEAYVILAMTLALSSFLRAGGDVFFDQQLPTGISGRFATQACLVSVWVAGIVLALAVLTDTPVGVVLSGLAGATALLAIVFKDSILGFVSGLQIAMNETLRVGDWIQIPHQEVDGIVVDISLTTVRIQNFNKSVSSVPSYSLVSQSFQNWRGMYESGVRRIKRSIHIDMDSVCCLSNDDREFVRNHEHLKQHWELDKTLRENHLSSTEPTNLCLLRNYLEAYLRSLPFLRDDLTLMVRHLPPGPEGMPIEIYAFSAEQEWTKFEQIQAEIFEHILVVLPIFSLRTFQLAPDRQTLIQSPKSTS